MLIPDNNNHTQYQDFLGGGGELWLERGGNFQLPTPVCTTEPLELRHNWSRGYVYPLTAFTLHSEYLGTHCHLPKYLLHQHNWTWLQPLCTCHQNLVRQQPETYLLPEINHTECMCFAKPKSHMIEGYHFLSAPLPELQWFSRQEHLAGIQKTQVQVLAVSQIICLLNE